MKNFNNLLKNVSLIVIFGYANLGKAIYQHIKKTKPNAEIIFCDNVTEKLGTYNGLEVVRPHEAFLRSKGIKSFFIIASFHYSIKMYEQLKKIGVSDDYIISKIPEKILDTAHRMDQIERMNTTAQYHIEVNINKHCNLNCMYCDHFASVAHPEFLELDIFAKDVKRVSTILSRRLYEFMILGGEPLLNPNIIKYVEIVRRFFPTICIKIVTNGILLLNMNEDFWKACKAYNVVIAVTKYPIALDYDFIERKVRSMNIPYTYMGGSKEGKSMWYFPFDLKGEQNPEESFKNCQSANHCMTLEKGRIYTCSVAANIDVFNKYFNQNIKLTDADGIDIYKVESAEELFKAMATPMPVCRYCNVTKRTYDNEWCISKKQINEWT